MTTLRRHGLAGRLIGVMLWALWLGLWLGPWAVLSHSIAHAPAPVSAPAKAASPAASVDDGVPWGHQAGSADCHLVDHLLTGQAPGGKPAGVAGLPSADRGLWADAAPMRPGARACAYQARGPPTG